MELERIKDRDKNIPATASGLVAYAQKMLHTPHVYLWGGCGEYLTREVLDKLAAKYPDWYTSERFMVRLRLADRGVRGWDCIGLIKSYVWGDYSQRSPEYPKETTYTTRMLRADPGVTFGELKDMPEIPGVVLWMQGHVGIYEGNGHVLECSFHYFGENELIGGIVRTRQEERNWEKWCFFPGIEYSPLL